MRYFWLLCHEAQKILNVSYHPGLENLGGYPTKVHNEAHHLRVRPFYQHMKESPDFYREHRGQVNGKGVLEGPGNRMYVRAHY